MRVGAQRVPLPTSGPHHDRGTLAGRIAFFPGFFIPPVIGYGIRITITRCKQRRFMHSLDEVILELYRLAETKAWNGDRTDEALIVALEAMEQIWSLRQADRRRAAKTSGLRKQPRVWS
jgi:hypothetical protein